MVDSLGLGYPLRMDIGNFAGNKAVKNYDKDLWVQNSTFSQLRQSKQLFLTSRDVTINKSFLSLNVSQETFILSLDIVILVEA